MYQVKVHRIFTYDAGNTPDFPSTSPVHLEKTEHEKFDCRAEKRSREHRKERKRNAPIIGRSVGDFHPLVFSNLKITGFL